MSESETPQQYAARVELEEFCAQLARDLADEVRPRSLGFVLLTWNLQRPIEGDFLYASNADRDVVVRLLDEAHDKIAGLGALTVAPAASAMLPDYRDRDYACAGCGGHAHVLREPDGRRWLECTHGCGWRRLVWLVGPPGDTDGGDRG